MSNNGTQFPLDMLMGLPNAMLSGTVLMVCGTYIQHSFRGVAYPYRPGYMAGQPPIELSWGSRFARSFFFGLFSWVLSFLLVAGVVRATQAFNINILVWVSSTISSSEIACYVFLANVILVILMTPILCIMGYFVRKKTRKDYIERMSGGLFVG